MQVSVSLVSVCIAGVAVISGPFASWLITRKQLSHSEKMQELQRAHDIRKQRIELAYRSDREWSSALRERISELISVSADIFVAKTMVDAVRASHAFSNAQSQVEILVSGDSPEHEHLRALVRDLSRTLRKAKLDSEETTKNVSLKRREIVDATRVLVESTCGRDYDATDLRA